MTMILAPSAIPNTYAHDERPHVCGMCRNPWTTGNPNCPNSNKDKP